MERDNFAITTRPLRSETVSLREMPGQGTIISAARARSSASSVNPFFVGTRLDPTNPNAYQWRVRPGSLFATVDMDSELEVDGIDVWTTLAEADSTKIFLDGTVDGLEATDVLVNSTTSDWPAPGTFDDTPAQNKFNRPIAEITFEDDLPVVRQITTTNLILQPVCFDPVAIIYPFPF